jgi:protein-tyrosine kinase
MIDHSLPKIRPASVAAAASQSAAAAATAAGETRRVVSVNRIALQAAGLSPEVGQERRFADQYRQIKRALIGKVRRMSAARTAGAQLVMMASALPGDGKTFTSINLALSIARERDVSCLLVDTDVPKPHVSGIFGIDHEPGLMDALMDKSVDVESLILPTDVPGLSILPVGRQDETASELLASARMTEVVGRLCECNPQRIVLLDSPPLILSSESRALAQVVGQVIMVVRAGGTPQEAVLEAISLIGADTPIALVLNQSQMASSDGYYGYGYAYGSYGDYGSNQPRPPADRHE